MRRLFANVQVHELFLEQAKLTPTATALVLPHEAKTVVTYQESDFARESLGQNQRARWDLEELAQAARQLAVVLERLGPLLTIKRQGASLRHESQPCEARMARSWLYLCREAARRWCRSSALCCRVPATCPWTTLGQRLERAGETCMTMHDAGIGGSWPCK